MSKPLDKQALVTSAWIAALRTQGHRQCRFAMAENGRVCALGLLGEIAGVLPHECEETFMPLAVTIGVTEEQIDEIWARNDGICSPTSAEAYSRHSFDEIADIMEGWFKP